MNALAKLSFWIYASLVCLNLSASASPGTRGYSKEDFDPSKVTTCPHLKGRDCPSSRCRHLVLENGVNVLLTTAPKNSIVLERWRD